MKFLSTTSSSLALCALFLSSALALPTAVAAPAPQDAAGVISYGALNKDHPPCPPGSPNCRPGAEANPYNRGCSAITQCRGAK